MDSVCYFPICVSKQNGRLVAALYDGYLSTFTFLISCAATCAKNNMGTCLCVDPLSDRCRPYTATPTEYFCEIIAALPLLCDYHPLWDAERSFGLRRGHTSLFSQSFTQNLLGIISTFTFTATILPAVVMLKGKMLIIYFCT